MALVVKNLPADLRDTGSIPGSGRSARGGNGNSLQYSCLENPMDRGAWWDIVHGAAKSQTQLSDCGGTQMPMRKQRFYSWPARDPRDEISSFPLKSMIPFLLPFRLRNRY